MRQRPYIRLGAAVSLVVLLASGCSTYQPGGQGATMNPNESNPVSTHPDRMYKAPRGDNPNLPNPVTPSAGNESAPQPQGTLRDPTNSPGR